MESILGLRWTGCIGNPFIWLRNPLISLFRPLFLIWVGLKHFKVSSLIWIGLRIFRCRSFCCLCFIGSSLGYLAACICEDWKGFLGFCSSKAAGCCFVAFFFFEEVTKIVCFPCFYCSKSIVDSNIGCHLHVFPGKESEIRKGYVHAWFYHVLVISPH